MTDETNDSAEAETDRVENSDSDDLETLDYYDPDEDDEVDENVNGTDDEDGEGGDDPDDPEEGTGEDDEPEASETPEAMEIAADALVKMPDGSTVKFGDLNESRMLKADHTRKTQELANERKTVQADVERMQRITETFVDHLSSLVPDAPDTSLAYSDPAKYTAQKAQHEAAMAQVQKLIEMGNAPKEISEAMSQADRQKLLRSENEKLIQHFPEAGTQEGRQKFFGEVQAVANDLGFTDEELNQVADHRIFALAHWAKKGMAAEQAKSKAKEKVAKAPPATPRKPGQGARKGNGNREAMRKLSQSGSLRDALAVDFD